MLRSGHCPQCGSATVYTHANGIVPGGRDREYLNQDGYYIPTDIVSFLCTTCGYYENYVADRQKLADISQKWQKVSPPAASNP